MRTRLAITVMLLAAGGATWMASRRIYGGKKPPGTAAVAVSGDKIARSMRPVHPFSVVPGGVFSSGEVQDWMRLDPVVARHYEGIASGALRPVRLAADRQAHVSYRRGDMVFWTPYKVTLRAGETILTDGVNEVRARCGNRIAAVIAGPAEALGAAPKEQVMDETLPAGLARSEFQPKHTPEWLLASVKEPAQEASREGVAAIGGSPPGSESVGGGGMYFYGGGGGLAGLPQSGGGAAGSESATGGSKEGTDSSTKPGSGGEEGAATGSTGVTGSEKEQLVGSISQPGLTPNPWLPPARDSITENGGSSGSTGTTGASGSTGATGTGGGGSTGSTGGGGGGSTGGTGSSGGSGFTGFTGFTGITGGSGGGGGGGGGFTGPTSTVQAVPEPATFLLVGSLLLSIGVFRKARRR